MHSMSTSCGQKKKKTHVCCRGDFAARIVAKVACCHRQLVFFFFGFVLFNNEKRVFGQYKAIILVFLFPSLYQLTH